MKVISKPTLPIQVCEYCKSVIKVKYRDLEMDGFSMRKILWTCPVCKGRNIVFKILEGGEENGNKDERQDRS